MCEIHEIIKQNNRKYGTKRIAAILGKSEFTVHKWGEDPDESGSPIPGNMIIPYSHATDSALLRYLNLMARTGKRPSRSLGSLTRGLCKSLKEFSDFMDVTSLSLKDNELTDKERRRIQKEGIEAIDEILSLLEAIKK